LFALAAAKQKVMTNAAKDAAFRDWCKADGVTKLQHWSVQPVKSSLHASTSEQPLHRAHQRPVSSTPKGVTPVPYAIHTDHMATYVPPKATASAWRDPRKVDTLARTAGWAPHTSNKPGGQRAVYDPVSHKTTLYTFDHSGGVSWTEGKGDKIMRDKALQDAQTGDKWHGRRKGVVEFVDRTHSSAVNKNDDYLAWCAASLTDGAAKFGGVNSNAYHTQTGELTKWMDNAFSSKMKVPFYGKHPHEMSR